MNTKGQMRVPPPHYLLKKKSRPSEPGRRAMARSFRAMLHYLARRTQQCTSRSKSWIVPAIQRILQKHSSHQLHFSPSIAELSLYYPTSRELTTNAYVPSPQLFLYPLVCINHRVNVARKQRCTAENHAQQRCTSPLRAGAVRRGAAIRRHAPVGERRPTGLDRAPAALAKVLGTHRADLHRSRLRTLFPGGAARDVVGASTVILVYRMGVVSSTIRCGGIRAVVGEQGRGK